jgi:hypothetical protein
MTTHADFYEQVWTYTELTARHELFLAEYRKHRAALGGRTLDVLDVGCGKHAVLRSGIVGNDRYWGTDVIEAPQVELDRYTQIDVNSERMWDRLGSQQFDVIFCGEVLEHVFSPDKLLRDLSDLMHDESLLILSTPNIAYWVNRLLLAAGFSPLFLENSSDVNLGRRTRFLGQGNPTQGHIRLFTYDAVLDLLKREGLELIRAQGVLVWNFPPDRLICRFSRRLAPDIVYMLRRPSDSAEAARPQGGEFGGEDLVPTR